MSEALQLFFVHLFPREEWERQVKADQAQRAAAKGPCRVTLGLGEAMKIRPEDFEKMRPENVPSLIAHIFKFKTMDFLQVQALGLLLR